MLGGRRGVGVHAGFGKLILELGESAVFRAEVVAPVADAVRLVNGERSDLKLLQLLQKADVEEPFGREKQQVDAV